MKRKQDLEWYGQMVLCFNETLTQAELQDLSQWEARNLPGVNIGTSDWPGWEKHIGKMSTGPIARTERRRA